MSSVDLRATSFSRIGGIVVRRSKKYDLRTTTNDLRDFRRKFLGIRDFIQYLREHREKAQKPDALSEAEREEILNQAEMMVGMAEAAARELESVIVKRRINLPEEHAVRFAQDVFLYLRDEEEKVKEKLR